MPTCEWGGRKEEVPPPCMRRTQASRVTPVKKHQFLSLFQLTLLSRIGNYSKMATNFSNDLYSYWFWIKKKKKRSQRWIVKSGHELLLPSRSGTFCTWCRLSVYYWRNTMWTCSKHKCALLVAKLKAALTGHNDWCPSSPTPQTLRGLPAKKAPGTDFFFLRTSFHSKV